MELTLPMIMMMTSTAVAAVGAIQQGNAAKSAANYNAALGEQNAVTERQQAATREDAQRRQARLILGEQRAGFAQAGAGLGGSAADVMQQSSTNAELDALTIRYEGDLRARGLMAGAALERSQGKQAQRAGYMSAAGSILGGVGSYGNAQATERYRTETLANQRRSLNGIN